MQRIRLIIVASLLALSLVGCAQQRADLAPEEVAALPATFANVVVTSHQAFLTQDALQNIADTPLESIREYEVAKRFDELTHSLAPAA